jgi:hypothetical protein
MELIIFPRDGGFPAADFGIHAAHTCAHARTLLLSVFCLSQGHGSRTRGIKRIGIMQLCCAASKVPRRMMFVECICAAAARNYL